ncbi:hypothetical protein P4O66_015491, partial [Electrophorus voltai]
MGKAVLGLPKNDTGAAPPESCLFSLMGTITAFAGFATMFARYKFVQRLTEKRGGVPPALNVATLVAAIVSCVGMCTVATFQEYTLHFASAVSEWTVAFTFVFFFFTYIQEFQVSSWNQFIALTP